jgi:tRNA 2-selenouridine synthase
MIVPLECASPADLAPFDDIIDVRTPAEFAEDHIPGAINLPVLSDAERARIGTMWSKESKFAARKAGAALIARAVAGHLEGALAGRPGSWRPLIYCWRGGQRSGAMAQILSEVGWRVGVLSGGYRTYRRAVVEALYERPLPLRLFLICGGTGVGKTDVLARLGAHGVQTLDLEALARHRGSLFGGFARQPQPSQKMFESALAAALWALSPDRLVVVEAESSRIGALFLPSAVWKAMLNAPRLVLSAPAAARARHVVRRYKDLVEDLSLARAAIAALPRHHAAERKAGWRTLLEASAFEALALELIESHYDPAYARQAGEEMARWPVAALEALEDADLAMAAEVVAEAVRQLDGAPGALGAGP